MKQVLRKDLPEQLQETLKDSRFVLMIPDVWGIPQIIAHGNDPVLVSQAGVAPEFEPLTAEQKLKVIEAMESGMRKPAAYEAAGVAIKSRHVYRNDQVCAPRGELYRIDEAKRGE
jgi:hypothetical protein